MKVIRWTDLEPVAVEEKEAKSVTMRMLISEPDGAANFRMRLFEVGEGGKTPYHQHPWEHEVFILDGEGVCVDEARHEHTIRPGDAVFVAPNQWHCFTNRGKVALRFLCLVPTKEIIKYRQPD